MKTIFAALDPNNFFKLEIDSNLFSHIVTAQQWLLDCPYEGYLWISTNVYHLNLGVWLPCKIEVTRECANAVVTVWDDEYLLECGDNVLKLPEVYLTRRFRLLIEDAKKYLSTHDDELMCTWKKFHQKILKN